MPKLRPTLALLFSILAAPARGAEAAPGPEASTPVAIEEAPWSGVGRINNSAYGRCSAILVRADVALTAAHCLYNIASRRFLQPASIHILFGFDRGRYGFHTTASAITIPASYAPGGGAASAPSDWAVVRLSAPVPAGFAPFALASRAEAAGRTVRAAGFGQERSERLSATPPCAVEGTSPDGALLVTRCRLSHGFSGGPLVDMASGRLVGMGIAIATVEGETHGIAIPAWRLAAELPPP